MKKMLLALFLVVPSFSHAEENQIVTTLLDHVSVATQFRSGKTELALMDSVVQIGNAGGSSILDLQLGFNGEVAPDPNEVTSADLIAGAQFKLSSLIQTKIDFPEQWEFLRAIEHGPAYAYNFRDKEWFLSYQVGLAFKLNPIQ